MPGCLVTSCYNWNRTPKFQNINSKSTDNLLQKCNISHDSSDSLYVYWVQRVESLEVRTVLTIKRIAFGSKSCGVGVRWEEPKSRHPDNKKRTKWEILGYQRKDRQHFDDEQE